MTKDIKNKKAKDYLQKYLSPKSYNYISKMNCPYMAFILSRERYFMGEPNELIDYDIQKEHYVFPNTKYPIPGICQSKIFWDIPCTKHSTRLTKAVKQNIDNFKAFGNKIVSVINHELIDKLSYTEGNYFECIAYNLHNKLKLEIDIRSFNIAYLSASSYLKEYTFPYINGIEHKISDILVPPDKAFKFMPFI